VNIPRSAALAVLVFASGLALHMAQAPGGHRSK
jgi:hypothetical protein